VAGAIRFGASVSVSGRYALQGRQVLAGLRAWVEAVNADKGLRVHGAGAKAPVRLTAHARVQHGFPTGGAGGSHVCRFRSGAWHLFAANR
jgi:hypothetical protein